MKCGLRVSGGVLAVFFVSACGPPPTVPNYSKPPQGSVPAGTIYVTNSIRGATTNGPESGVAVFSAVTGAADVAPSSFFPAGGPSLAGLALDAYDDVYVADKGSSVVNVFLSGKNPSHPSNAAITAVTAPSGIAVDPTGNVIVLGRSSGMPAIVTFSQTNLTSPLRIISGTNTGMTVPTGIAFSSQTQTIYVTDAAKQILAFPVGGSGNVAPATIGGPKTTLATPAGIAVGSNGALYVADGTNVVEFARGALGNTSPIAEILGPTTYGPTHLIGIALDARDNVYVADVGSAYIFSGVPEVEIFAAASSGLQTPLGSIDSSSETGLASLGGIAVSPQTIPPNPIALNPPSVAFTTTGAGSAANVTAAENSYAGSFTASPGCTGIATIASGAQLRGSETFLVTPVSGGTCSFSIADATGKSATLPVSVAARTSSIVLSQTGVSFLGVAATPVAITASEAGYSGTLTASSTTCASIASIAPITGVAPFKFTVDPLAAGSCSYTIGDTNGASAALMVTVTTTELGGQ